MEFRPLGKTGLNVSDIKNQIGTFHQPRVVYVVKDLLKDLPERQCHSALGEFAKMALIAGTDCSLPSAAVWS